MIRFLDTGGTLREARRLIRECDEAVLAVAFWGRGAQERLGLNTSHVGKIKIICDPESGACNPDVLDKMSKMGFKILYIRNFHAKVLWTPAKMIVGSSNISANGLGFEGAETVSNFEANVLTDDAHAIGKARTWIDSLLTLANPITADMLEDCRIIWKLARARRAAHGPIKKTTLSYRLQIEPHYFGDRPIEVWAFFDDEPSIESNQQTERVQASFANAEITQFELAYEDKSLAGRVVLWFAKKEGVQTYQAAYRLIDIPPSETVKEDGVPYFNHYCVEIDVVDGCTIDREFQKRVAALLPTRRPREIQFRRSLAKLLV